MGKQVYAWSSGRLSRSFILRSPKFGDAVLFSVFISSLFSKTPIMRQLFWGELISLQICYCRLLIPTFLPWLKLRRTVVTVLNFSWGLLGINLFVREQPGPMGSLAAKFHILSQCTVANFVNRIRYTNLFQWKVYIDLIVMHIVDNWK